jgi:hypothetical protein
MDNKIYAYYISPQFSFVYAWHSGPSLPDHKQPCRLGHTASNATEVMRTVFTRQIHVICYTTQGLIERDILQVIAGLLYPSGMLPS